MSISGESERGNSKQSILCACLPKTSTRHGSEPLLGAAVVAPLLPRTRDRFEGPRTPLILQSKSKEASMHSMRVKTCSVGFDYYALD